MKSSNPAVATIYRTREYTPIAKSPTIAIRRGVSEWPLVYLRRPSCVPQSAFDLLLDKLTMAISPEDADAIMEMIEETMSNA